MDSACRIYIVMLRKDLYNQTTMDNIIMTMEEILGIMPKGLLKKHWPSAFKRSSFSIDPRPCHRDVSCLSWV